MINFQKKIEKTNKKNNSLLCVGLDSDLEKIPKRFKKQRDPVFSFNKWIINQTKDLVCCYKPDIAFYEAYGFETLRSLKRTIDYIHKLNISVLLDVKKGSVGHTSEMYAKNVFEFWKADAITVNVFTGVSGLVPFLKYKDKWTFAYIASSNLDGQEFQKAKLKSGEMLYEYIAKKLGALKEENIGAIVPGTDPSTISKIRQIMPDGLFLIPGIGAQGGNLKNTVNVGLNSKKSGIIINSSRSIIFSENPREEAKKLRDEINQYRN